MPKKAKMKPENGGPVSFTVRLRPRVYNALLRKTIEDGSDFSYMIEKMLRQFLDKVEIAAKLRDEASEPWDKNTERRGGTDRRKGDRRQCEAG